MRASKASQRGLSLIELLIALLISVLLAYGIVQIFGASRVTYQTQEGLSRVQESGRYITQYLQRQLRMVGYMGCASDTERAAQASFVNHLALYDASVPGGDAVTDPSYRFQRPIEAFASSALPAYLTTLLGTPSATGAGPLPNTDVLVIRVLGDVSVPVVSSSLNTLNTILTTTVASGTATVFPTAAAPVILYGLQTCRSVDVFAGQQTAAGAVTVTATGNVAPNRYLDPTVTSCGAGGCPWDFRISNAFLNAPDGTLGLQLNGELHRAEFYVFYVSTNALGGPPGLYMKRFPRGGYSTSGVPAEELAEGVESLNLSFGVDTDGDGQLDEYDSAATIAANNAAGTDAGLDAKWRQVVSVRIGLLISSPDFANVVPLQSGLPRTYTVLGTSVTPATPNDGKLRQVYETTIALRNRIFNS